MQSIAMPSKKRDGQKRDMNLSSKKEVMVETINNVAEAISNNPRLWLDPEFQ